MRNNYISDYILTKSELIFENIDILDEFLESSVFRDFFIKGLSNYLDIDNVFISFNNRAETDRLDSYTIYKESNDSDRCIINLFTINKQMIFNHFHGRINIYLFIKLLIRNWKIKTLLE